MQNMQRQYGYFGIKSLDDVNRRAIVTRLADEFDLPTPVSYNRIKRVVDPSRIDTSDTSLLLDADRVAVEKNLQQRERERTAEEIAAARRRQEENIRVAKEEAARQAQIAKSMQARLAQERQVAEYRSAVLPPNAVPTVRIKKASSGHLLYFKSVGNKPPIIINDQHPMYNIMNHRLEQSTNPRQINNALRDERLRQRNERKESAVRRPS
jgi:hypothetical protein